MIDAKMRRLAWLGHLKKMGNGSKRKKLMRRIKCGVKKGREDDRKEEDRKRDLKAKDARKWKTMAKCTDG